MPPVATCSRCSAAFVPDDPAHGANRRRKAAWPWCESCRRAAIERALAKDWERANGTGIMALVFLMWAVASYEGLIRRNDRLPWEALFAVGVAAGVLSGFFYLCRVRPRMRMHLTYLARDRATGESANVRRSRALRELGHPTAWTTERKALRRRRERALEKSVRAERESPAILREERRRNRLLDRLDDVDQRIRSMAAAIETGNAFPQDREPLERLQTRLLWKLEHPPVWPHVLGYLVSKGFFSIALLPFTALAYRFLIAACRGNFIAVAITVAGAIITAVMMASLQPEWLSIIWRKVVAKPAGDHQDDNDPEVAPA
jgi:hypothetical protein